MIRSTYLAAAILVVGLAGLASLIPSARAARVSAADALRAEWLVCQLGGRLRTSGDS